MAGPLLKSEMMALPTGTRAWLVRPPSAPGAGIVVLPESFGLNPWIQGVCTRFARAGYLAVAPDLYRGEVFAYADHDAARARAERLDDDSAIGDVAASIDALAAEGARNDNLAVVGFGNGGRLAFLANATHGRRLAAAVSFHAGEIAANGATARRPPIDRAADLHAPQLLIYGAKDSSIGPDEHARVARALSCANRRYTLAVLPDAGHAFATEDRETFQPEAAAAAWRITFAFLVDAVMH